MAAKEFNDWVKGDVAIEIIGKMIAEEMATLHSLLSDYNLYSPDTADAALQNDSRYTNCRAKIRQYQQEIQAIYRNADGSAILQKATEVYAPLLLERQKTAVLHQ